MKKKKKRRIRPFRILFLLILLIGIPVGLTAFYRNLPAYRSMHLKIQRKYYQYDNGTIDTMKQVQNPDSFDSISVNQKSFSLHEPGWHTVSYLCKKDHVFRVFHIRFHVNDSERPVITFKQFRVWVAQGSDFDPTENIASVQDPVDGDLEYRKKKPSNPVRQDKKVYEKGWYTVQSNADVNTPGTYQVYILACDQNGNETDASYRVEVY